MEIKNIEINTNTSLLSEDSFNILKTTSSVSANEDVNLTFTDLDITSGYNLAKASELSGFINNLTERYMSSLENEDYKTYLSDNLDIRNIDIKLNKISDKLFVSSVSSYPSMYIVNSSSGDITTSSANKISYLLTKSLFIKSKTTKYITKGEEDNYLSYPNLDKYILSLDLYGSSSSNTTYFPLVSNADSNKYVFNVDTSKNSLSSSFYPIELRSLSMYPIALNTNNNRLASNNRPVILLYFDISFNTSTNTETYENMPVLFFVDNFTNNTIANVLYAQYKYDDVECYAQLQYLYPSSTEDTVIAFNKGLYPTFTLSSSYILQIKNEEKYYVVNDTYSTAKGDYGSEFLSIFGMKYLTVGDALSYLSEDAIESMCQSWGGGGGSGGGSAGSGGQGSGGNTGGGFGTGNNNNDDIIIDSSGSLINSSFGHMYIINNINANKVQDAMLSKDIIWSIQNMFVSLSDCIINLLLFPFQLDVSNQQYRSAITVKNIILDEPENVEGYEVVNRYANNFSYGTFTFEEYFGTFLDYSPYTKISMFIPYVGFVDLNTDSVMGRTVELRYGYSLFDGSGVAYILVDDVILYSYECTLGTEIPITTSNAQNNIQSAIKTGIGGLVGLGVGALASPMTGGSSLALASLGVGASTSSKLLAPTTYNSGGKVSGNLSQNLAYVPYVIIERVNTNIPDGFGNITGYATNLYSTLNGLKGFTQCEKVKIAINGTSEESEMICNILESGVIL